MAQKQCASCRDGEHDNITDKEVTMPCISQVHFCGFVFAIAWPQKRIGVAMPTEQQWRGFLDALEAIPEIELQRAERARLYTVSALVEVLTAREDVPVLLAQIRQVAQTCFPGLVTS